MLVKIKRDTIRRNPRAGNTVTPVAGRSETTFVLNGKLPKYLKDGVNITITRSVNNLTYIGILHDVSLIDKIIASAKRAKKNKFTVHIETNNEIHHIDHAPEPTHFAEYENPLITCDHCKSMLPVSDVMEDFDDEGMEITLCPICREIDTFEEIKYEKLADVLDEIRRKENQTT